MLDTKKQIVNALNTVLPTYYQAVVDSTYKTPCITYLEKNNYELISTQAAGISRVEYYIRIWADTVSDISKYSVQVDEVMRSLGFTREGTYEASDGAILCLTINYYALGFEKY